MLLACVGDGTATVDDEAEAAELWLVGELNDAVDVVDPDPVPVAEVVGGGPVTTLTVVDMVDTVGVKVACGCHTQYWKPGSNVQFAEPVLSDGFHDCS